MATQIPGPIDLEACLLGGQSFVWRRTPDGYEGVVGDRLVRVTPDGTGARVHGMPKPDARTYFRADDDPAPAKRRLVQDPVLQPRIQRWPGLRVLRTDPWTALVSFILSQNSNVPRITRNLQDLAEASGPPVAHRHAVPAPETIASTPEADLRKLGLGYRAPYLRQTAQRVADGDPDLDRLIHAPYDEARQTLLTLPGVGPKVAECVLLFGLHHGSAFPVDRWVARSVGELYPDAPDRPDDVPAWARKRFGPDAGLAQQLLFHDRRVTDP